MKQRLFILAAASAVAFAACNSGNEGSYTQEQLDSITNAKMDSTKNAMTAMNDSIIAAQAAEEAARLDSIRIADSLYSAGKNSVSKTTVTKKTTTPTKGGGVKEVKETKEETVTKPTGSLNEKSDQAKNQGSLRDRSDQAKQQQSSGGSLRNRSDQAKQNQSN
jgi:hypothetical protein